MVGIRPGTKRMWEKKMFEEFAKGWEKKPLKEEERRVVKRNGRSKTR